ncbi:endo alpha-1,4 polygalactosaminidase [Streptomyces sp. NPDC059786]|uniref:endo alpha-1,4 polygalactosaminidase n=1 Tax=Streptomyces sp. NPDC059786 TaxID=3346946 RepID=UPI00365AF24C
MRNNSFPARRSAALLAVSAALASFLTACSGDSSDGTRDAGGTSSASSTGKVTLPPVHAGFDYQLGGPTSPPDGVGIVTRDHTASPASGVYNICYVNAFQAQPDAEQDWDSDLLLHDDSGDVVMDEDWGEAILDISTAGKRERIAEKVDGWIDQCASKGFQAVDPDNYDSYTRVPDGLLSADDAKAFLTLLADHAHEKGLAIGQKNTVDLAPARKRVGLDFAVVEECGAYDECGGYVDAFGDHVMVIEYTERGLRRACDGWGDDISIVRRDLDLVPEGDSGYLRETCDDL